MVILKLARKGLRSSILRMLLTVVAIAAGVSFVSGSFILSDSLSAEFTQLFEEIAEDTDGVVQPTQSEFGAHREFVPPALVETIVELDEVASARPMVISDPSFEYRPVEVLDSGANSVLPPGPPVIVIGWDGEVSETLKIIDGEPPSGAGEIALDEQTITFLELKGEEVGVGDTIAAATPSGKKEYVVAAIVELPQVGNTYAVFDIETTQQLLGRGDSFDQVELSVADGFTVEAMGTAVSKAVPAGFEFVDQEALVNDSLEQFNAFIGIFRGVLLGYAFVSLFISLFIIYNTFSAKVQQNLREIGVLRAVGATRSQTTKKVLIEALMVGLIGTLLGLVGGIGINALIIALLDQLGSFPNVSMVYLPRTAIVSLMVGLVATAVSAFAPAWAAGKVSPVVAINGTQEKKSPKRRVTIGFVITTFGLVMMGLGLFGFSESTSIIFSVGVGAVACFVGVAMLSALFASQFVTAIGRPLVLGASLLLSGVVMLGGPWLFGDDGVPWTYVFSFVLGLLSVIIGSSMLISKMRGKPTGLGGSYVGLRGQMARLNAARSPQRTATTATALTIGVALLCTVAVVGESLRGQIGQILDGSITADLFVSDASQQGFAVDAGDLIGELDSVESMARFQGDSFWVPSADGLSETIRQAAQSGEKVVPSDLVGEGNVSEDVVAAMAYNSESGEDFVRFDVREGTVGDLGTDGVLVYKDNAEDLGLAVGDEIPVLFSDYKAETLRVKGIFHDNSVLASPFIIDSDLLASHRSDPKELFLVLRLEDGVTLESAKEEVKVVADDFKLLVQDPDELIESVSNQLSGLMTVINVLLGFALCVALIGVMNTIAMSVVERTREIGLLRAVGMTRRQLRGVIRWESVVVCLFGAVLGVALGAVFAVAAIQAIPDDVLSVTVVPINFIVTICVLAVVMGVISAVIPSFKAGRLNVLDAISTDE